MRENVCHINNCVRVHESEGERVCACVSNAVLCVCVFFHRQLGGVPV